MCSAPTSLFEYTVQGALGNIQVRMPRHGHPTPRDSLVEKLPVAALLTPQCPPFPMKPLQNLPYFHDATLPRTHAHVNTPNAKLSDCRRKRKV